MPSLVNAAAPLASGGRRLHRGGGIVMFMRMLNILSILIGLVVLVLALVAFIPFLGWINWALVLLAIVGAGLGALSSRSAGRNLNILMLVVCGVRLMLGGGLI